ncbi:MAG: hypothetical protein EYC62_07875 [Alphaproteobacteria bacterium]|nr:MAG: hypothetical protein EYC62_07875 [Alphaproteobacteria bacterium]
MGNSPIVLAQLLLSQSQEYGGAHSICPAAAQLLPVEEMKLDPNSFLYCVLEERPQGDMGFESTFMIICGNGKLIFGQSPIPKRFKELQNENGPTGRYRSLEWIENIGCFVTAIVNDRPNDSVIVRKNA